MKKETAKAIVDMAFSYAGRLDQTVVKVQAEANGGEEFERYRLAVGHVLGDMLVDVLRPIFWEHPDLEPEWLKP